MRMISSLRGTVLSAGGTTAVLEVGGVGFAIETTPEVVRSLHPGDEALLHTALIVREDALSLFGFAERLDLEVFRLLVGVSGVGPRSALGVLAELGPHRIAAAVRDEDHLPFQKVSGIGPKTAKLIVLQLAGKLAPPSARTSARPAEVAATVLTDVTRALVGLGWPERVATEAVADAAADASAEDRASVPALLRRTLAALGPAKQGSTRV